MVKRTRKINKILGLDLSLNSTGWCFIKGDFLDYGLINTKEKGVKRLAYIEDKIIDLIYVFEPNITILEGYSFGSRGRATFSTGELGGIIRLLLLNQKIKTIIVPPTCLKKFITGKGNSGKEIMLMKTLSKYGIEFNNNNECDAYGLTQMGKVYLEGTNIKYEQEALKGIEIMK